MLVPHRLYASNFHSLTVHFSRECQVLTQLTVEQRLLGGCVGAEADSNISVRSRKNQGKERYLNK